MTMNVFVESSARGSAKIIVLPSSGIYIRGILLNIPTAHTQILVVHKVLAMNITL